MFEKLRRTLTTAAITVVVTLLSISLPSGAKEVDTIRLLNSDSTKILSSPNNIGYPVVFQRDTLFSVISNTGTFTGAERAERISEQLLILTTLRKLEWDSFRVSESEYSSDISYGTQLLCVVLTTDLIDSTVSRHQTALQFLDIIKQKIFSYRANTSPQAVWSNIGESSLYLLSFIILLFILAKMYKWMVVSLTRLANRRQGGFSFRGFELMHLSTFLQITTILLGVIRTAISLVAFYYLFLHIWELFPYTRQWDVTPLLSDIGVAILLTVALVVAFKVGKAFVNGLQTVLSQWIDKHFDGVKIRDWELLSKTRIQGVITGLVRNTKLVAIAAVIYFYLTILFRQFDYTQTWSKKLLDLIVHPLHATVVAFVAYLPSLFTIAVIIVVTYYFIKGVRFLFDELASGAFKFSGFHLDLINPTYKIVRLVIIVCAVIVIFPYLPGADSKFFQGITVFIGVMLSFGSSSAISNIIAGIILTYMRPFQVGDRVKITDTVGDIVEKTLLITRIRTIKNVEVTIPNSIVLSSHIVNYSTLSDNRELILQTSVTIGYDAPWRIVHQLLIDAAGMTTDVSSDPKPFVLQIALNDFYVEYELNAYTNAPTKMAVIYSDLHQNIQDCFIKAGVEIMSPHYRALRDGDASTIPEK